MADRPVYIHAAAALGAQGDYLPTQRRRLNADPEPYELKTLIKQRLGQPLRQASHFVELTALGAQLCIQHAQPLAPDTAVYLGTGLGEVRKTAALFTQVMTPPGWVSPFDFINAANNMAAFYVAKLAGLRGRNLTVMQEEFSFEWALALAQQDLQAGRISYVLVGGADESSRPRSAHLRRLRLTQDQIMGEGSGWMYLGAEPVVENGRRALGEVLRVEPLTMRLHDDGWEEQAAQVLASLCQDRQRAYLLPGFRLERAQAVRLAALLPGVECEHYLDYCGCFHSASAFGLAAIFERAHAEPRRYFHLNADQTGRLMLVAVEAYAQAH